MGESIQKTLERREDLGLMMGSFEPMQMQISQGRSTNTVNMLDRTFTKHLADEQDALPRKCSTGAGGRTSGSQGKLGDRAGRQGGADRAMGESIPQPFRS